MQHPRLHVLFIILAIALLSRTTGWSRTSVPGVATQCLATRPRRRGLDGTRTRDGRLDRAVLYQLSYKTIVPPERIELPSMG